MPAPLALSTWLAHKPQSRRLWPIAERLRFLHLIRRTAHSILQMEQTMAEPTARLLIQPGPPIWPTSLETAWVLRRTWAAVAVLPRLATTAPSLASTPTHLRWASCRRSDGPYTTGCS